MITLCQRTFAAMFSLLALAGPALAQDDRFNRRQLIEAGLEPELWQSSLRYLMGAFTGDVHINETCPEELPPRDVCLQPPTFGFFGHADLGHITLPRNSTKDAFIFMSTARMTYRLQNLLSPDPVDARFRIQPFAVIESEALNDPRAFDEEGLPLLGPLSVVTGVTTQKSMMQGETFAQSHNGVSRVFVLTKSAIRSTGLPEDIVDRIFKDPITIRLGLFGSANSADATLGFNVRVFGN